MLNKRAIFEVLSKAPLCHGSLIQQAGFDKNHVEYCAMGALAKSVGASDDALRRMDNMGEQIWETFGPKLQEKFGIKSLTQFQSLMRANDAEQFATRRNKAVMSRVEAMSPEQVNEIINESISEEAPLSAESITENGE